MKRRDFFSKVLITGSALTLGIGCKRRIEPTSAEVELRNCLLVNNKE